MLDCSFAIFRALTCSTDSLAHRDVARGVFRFCEKRLFLSFLTSARVQRRVDASPRDDVRPRVSKRRNVFRVCSATKPSPTHLVFVKNERILFIAKNMSAHSLDDDQMVFASKSASNRTIYLHSVQSRDDQTWSIIFGFSTERYEFLRGTAEATNSFEINDDSKCYFHHERQRLAVFYFFLILSVCFCFIVLPFFSP